MSNFAGYPLQKLRLKFKCVPCIFPWTEKNENVENRDLEACKAGAQDSLLDHQYTSMCTAEIDPLQISTVESKKKKFRTATNGLLESQLFSTSNVDWYKESEPWFVAVKCETGIDDVESPNDVAEPLGYPVKQYESKETQTHFPRYSIEQYENNIEGIHHFTGLDSYKKFQAVLSSLGPRAYHLQYERECKVSISVMNQLFLVLWKLRKNSCDYELSENFSVPRSAVPSIIRTWIRFMASMWLLSDLWPSRDLIDFYMQQSFKHQYPTTKEVIGAVERTFDKRGGYHVEKMTGSLKTYTILSIKLDIHYATLASEIIGVCVMLCNFKKCIL